jgi:hypothetical protein
VVNGVAVGVQGVSDGAFEEGDPPVLFAHEDVAELMGDHEGTQGTDGVDEERVRAVEGIDVAGAIGERGPAGGLDGAGDFEGELIAGVLLGLKGILPSRIRRQRFP